MAYVNISGRPSRRERSECRDSDVHGAGVYWPMGVIKFVGGGGGDDLVVGVRRQRPCGTVRCILGISFLCPYNLLFFLLVFVI
jgi:hypothetical protein